MINNNENSTKLLLTFFSRLANFRFNLYKIFYKLYVATLHPKYFISTNQIADYKN